MEKWQPFSPADALSGLPISMLTDITRDLHVPENQVRTYIRVCDLYDGGYRVKACEQILESNGPQRVAIISNQDVEFLSRNESEHYGWVEMSLTDPDFLQELYDHLSGLPVGPYLYQVWTDRQRAALIRLPNPDYTPEEAVAAAAIVVVPSLICNDGQEHDLRGPVYPWSTGGRVPPFHLRFCYKCGCPVCVNLVR